MTGVAHILVALFGIIATVLSFVFFFTMCRLPSKLDTWREHFFRNLLRFARHGVPLTVGIDRLTESASWPYNGWLGRVAEALSAGVPLDQAVCPDDRDSFGPISLPQLMPEQDAVLLRRASEGVPLETVLSQLAAKYAARVDFRQRLRTQLLLPIYLVFFLMAAIVTVSGLSTFVLPAFEEIFSDLGSDLNSRPWEYGVSSAYLALPFAIFSLIIVCLVYINPRSRRLRNLIVRLPWVGSLVRLAEWGLIGRHLEAAVSCERPLVSAVNDLPTIAFSGKTAAQLQDVAQQMTNGTAPAKALASLGLPAGWHALVDVGLSGGDLAMQLGEGSSYLEELLIERISLVERAFGAGIVLAAGLVVGLIVTGVFGALLAITELV